MNETNPMRFAITLANVWFICLSPPLFFPHIGMFLFSRQASAPKIVGAAGVSRTADVGNEAEKKSQFYH